MIYTLAQLRTFTRSVDNRLENAIDYPDTWIDYRIEEGLALAQEIKQIFSTKEKYDLRTNIEVDTLTEMEIILQKEPYSIWAMEYDQVYFTTEITANNHIIVRVVEGAPKPDDLTITIRYFYYPTLPIVNIEMTMEMYRLWKYCVEAVCYDYLQDKENEQYSLAKAESMVVKGTFDIEKDLMSIPEERLWSRSWA